MKAKTPKPERVPISRPEQSTRVRLIGPTGEYRDTSVINIWRRDELTEDIDGPFKMRDAAAALFNTSPAIQRVAYLWFSVCPLFLGGDSHGRWFDVTGTPVTIEFLSGDRAFWEGHA